MNCFVKLIYSCNFVSSALIIKVSAEHVVPFEDFDCWLNYENWNVMTKFVYVF